MVLRIRSPAHERRISDERIEPAPLDHDFGEFSGQWNVTCPSSAF